MIFEFLEFLNKKEVPYVLLNGYKNLSQQSHNSDVDIMFKKKDFKRMDSFISAFCQSYSYKKVQSYHQGIWAKNLFIYSEENGELLNLDIYATLKQNHIELFDQNEIFNNRYKYKTLDILSPYQEFIYYLLKKIGKKELSEDNYIQLKELYSKSQKKCEEKLSELLPDDCLMITSDLVNLSFNDFKSKIIEKDFVLQGNSTSAFVDHIKNIKRISQRIISPTGISICFLGPDGSGKSTIIDQLMSSALPFRRIDYFHLKPIKASSKDKKIVANPHEKEKYNYIKSYIKVLYLIWQYNFGWIKNIFPLKIRSSLVIFDRYFDDLLADNVRYRYGGSKKIIEFARQLVPQPSIYFILTSSADIIFKRKQEVKFEELEKQILLYRSLCDGKQYYCIDVNRSPEIITKEILSILMNKMNERY